MLSDVKPPRALHVSCCCCCAVCAVHCAQEDTELATFQTDVLTSLGRVRGTTDHRTCSWKGIPYALPLESRLRFSPPEPLARWNGTLDASRFGSIAPQRSLLRTKVGPDCLTLNIWSPAADAKRRPVLFFIHGGAFSHGAGSESFYHGAYLASRWDIVVVTCNYRLGIFGFLDFSLLDGSCSGNNGLRDVLTALRWTHDHIGDFGGDPQNITIAGQSAGGTMVSALASMRDTHRLYRQAIMMSGGPTQLQSRDSCRISSEAFVTLNGIETCNELYAADLQDLVTKQKRFMRKHGLGAATFRITVDEDLVHEFPIVAARKGVMDHLPFLIGTTKEEMGFMAIKPLARLIDVGNIVNKGLEEEDPQIRQELLDTYVALYGEDRGIPMMYTDLLFRISSTWFARNVASGQHAWMYRFDYETQILRMNGFHAIHSSDLPYVFGNFKTALVRPMFLLTPDMSQVRAVADEVQQDIVSFMREGSLPWDPCTDEHPLGKCYDDPPTIGEMVDRRLDALHDRTRYKYRSFHGISL